MSKLAKSGLLIFYAKFMVLDGVFVGYDAIIFALK